MEVNVSKEYLAILFILWVAPVIAGIWGAPVWVMITFMSFFAIYAGHEWVHVWICRINHLEVEGVFLETGGKTHILFEPAEGANKNKIESDVYLAGVAWDSIWFTIALLSSLFYGLLMGDAQSFIVGISLILILLINLAFPGSDWQEFMRRTPKRA